MNYVLDTNILIHMLTGSVIGLKVKANIQKNNPTLIISIVTKAEIISIAKQRRWGKRSMIKLHSLLKEFLAIPINNDEIVEVYAELDAFSQGKLAGKPLGQSSRNMGKNDLWIAATAKLTKSTLLTTDNDFDHLDPQYFPIEKLN